MSSERFFVVMKSGRKFCVEPIGDVRTDWGNITFGERKGLETVASKETNTINESNSIITKENGYKNICYLSPGTSPFGYLDILDKSGIERIEGSKWVRYVDDGEKKFGEVRNSP